MRLGLTVVGVPLLPLPGRERARHVIIRGAFERMTTQRIIFRLLCLIENLAYTLLLSGFSHAYQGIRLPA